MQVSRWALFSVTWLFVAVFDGVFAMEPSRDRAAPHDAQDPFTWLEERNSERALAWVKQQNAETIRQLKTDPLYQRRYDTALRVALATDVLPGAEGTIGWIHDGFIYHISKGQDRPRGVLRRAPLSSFSSESPAWQRVLDVDALGRADGTEYLLYPGTCIARRCMLPLLSVAAGTMKWMEFDLDSLEFVRDGFRFDSPNIPLWKDRDTLILVVEPGGQLHDQAYPTAAIRMWSRGQSLSTAATVMGAREPHTLYSAGVVRNSPKSQAHIFIEERDGAEVTKRWKFRDDGQLTPIHGPPSVSRYGYASGQWIFLLEQDWKTESKHWKAGTLVALEDATDPKHRPVVRAVKEPGARETIDELSSTENGLLVVSHLNVRGRLSHFTFDGKSWAAKQIALPDFGSVTFGMYGSPTHVTFESYLHPPTLYDVDPRTARARVIKSTQVQFAADRFVTEQFEAVSRDGTHVPFFMTRPKTLPLNGRAPTLLHAYGGNGMPTYPYHDATLGRLWLEQGGVYVVANIRGGGEFGPAWHYAAVRTGRERSFEDFAAVARSLIERNITSPHHLGATGFSNGGGLMGVMFNRHPELFNAIVSENGVLDWIRTDLQNDPAYVERERGSPRIPQERAFLDKVSPYQNLKRRPGAFPPFIVTSTTDDNVFPVMSRKFAVKLSALAMPYYYYEAPEGGHGQFGTPEQQALYYALKYTYLSQRLLAAEERRSHSE